jgi:hypothetical protein
MHQKITFILPENAEQGLHAYDTAADRSLASEQNWQWDEFLARNKIQLEHNKLQQLEELLLCKTKYTTSECTQNLCFESSTHCAQAPNQSFTNSQIWSASESGQPVYQLSLWWRE